MIRFLLDEHVAKAYARELRRRAPDLIVWRVAEPAGPSRGTPDPELLRWCEEHGFVLLTRDRKTMPKHLADHLAAGGHVPGIVILRSGTPMGETLDDLLLLGQAADQDDLSDRITYLPLL